MNYIELNYHDEYGTKILPDDKWAFHDVTVIPQHIQDKITQHMSPTGVANADSIDDIDDVFEDHNHIMIEIDYDNQEYTLGIDGSSGGKYYIHPIEPEGAPIYTTRTPQKLAQSLNTIIVNKFT
jgi:hypothetical protein